MDFVHLHDMLVMFPPAVVRAATKASQIKTVARECSVAAGVQVSGLRYRIGLENRKARMSKSAIRLLTLAIFSMALIAIPLLTSGTGLAC